MLKRLPEPSCIDIFAELVRAANVFYTRTPEIIDIAADTDNVGAYHGDGAGIKERDDGRVIEISQFVEVLSKL